VGLGDRNLHYGYVCTNLELHTDCVDHYLGRIKFHQVGSRVQETLLNKLYIYVETPTCEQLLRKVGLLQIVRRKRRD
jgi:hypothetical protein